MRTLYLPPNSDEQARFALCLTTKQLCSQSISPKNHQVANRAATCPHLRGPHRSRYRATEPSLRGDAPDGLSTAQEQIQEQATSHLREFSATSTSQSPANTLYRSSESEIQRTADEHGADVIVVGSHGHGQHCYWVQPPMACCTGQWDVGQFAWHNENQPEEFLLR